MGYYYKRREHESWGRNAKLERTMTLVVIVAVVLLLAVFLVVYNDLPFRVS